jgi:hypothetical protein
MVAAASRYLKRMRGQRLATAAARARQVSMLSNMPGS